MKRGAFYLDHHGRQKRRLGPNMHGKLRHYMSRGDEAQELLTREFARQCRRVRRRALKWMEEHCGMAFTQEEKQIIGGGR